jgi:hypothetical protein
MMLPVSGIISTYVLLVTLGQKSTEVGIRTIDLLFTVSGINILMALLSIFMNSWIKTSILIIVLSVTQSYVYLKKYKNRKLA